MGYILLLFIPSLTWHHDEALHVVLQPGSLAAGQQITAADGAAHLTLASPGHLRSHIIIIRILSDIIRHLITHLINILPQSECPRCRSSSHQTARRRPLWWLTEKLRIIVLKLCILLDLTFFLALLHHEEHLLMKHRPWQLWRTPRRRRAVYFIMNCKNRDRE